MLLPLDGLKNLFHFQLSGVLHVGGHHGEEVDKYLECGAEHVVLFEPCLDALMVLTEKFGQHPQVDVVPLALGDYNGFSTMHVETANQGASNSLLQPALHLQQYPNIRFERSEKVQVMRLDDLMQGEFKALFGRHGAKFNFLNMDVQGYEDRVLRGAPITLLGIDYVYTEVNRAEVYTDCARVELIDELLTDFTRVKTDWRGESWGDAFYIRKTLL